MDTIFNRLHKEGKLSYAEAGTHVGWPAFVDWRNNKPRVVIDIRGLNAASEKDAYPLQRTKDIITRVAGHKYLSVFNLTAAFLQRRILPQDCWKATVVSHRGLEVFGVMLMGYLNGPQHMQRGMVRWLRFLHEWSSVFIDDVTVMGDSCAGLMEEGLAAPLPDPSEAVISAAIPAVSAFTNAASVSEPTSDYSPMPAPTFNSITHFSAYLDSILASPPESWSSVSDHVAQLDLFFISIPKKARVGFQSAKLLGKIMDALGVVTDLAKLEAVASFKYPETLKDLERFVDLVSYLGDTIPHAAQLVSSLQALKTLLLKPAPYKGKLRRAYSQNTCVPPPTATQLSAFELCKATINQAPKLYHMNSDYYTYIYVDVSKDFASGRLAYRHKRGCGRTFYLCLRMPKSCGIYLSVYPKQS